MATAAPSLRLWLFKLVWARSLRRLGYPLVDCRGWNTAVVDIGRGRLRVVRLLWRPKRVPWTFRPQ